MPPIADTTIIGTKPENEKKIYMNSQTWNKGTAKVGTK